MSKSRSPIADPDWEHRAHLVSLTTMWMPDTEGTPRPVGPIVATQCSGRIGWDYKRENHPWMELYRGNDQAEAERVRDIHNATEHASVTG